MERLKSGVKLNVYPFESLEEFWESVEERYPNQQRYFLYNEATGVLQAKDFDEAMEFLNDNGIFEELPRRIIKKSDFDYLVEEGFDFGDSLKFISEENRQTPELSAEKDFVGLSKLYDFSNCKADTLTVVDDDFPSMDSFFEIKDKEAYFEFYSDELALVEGLNSIKGYRVYHEEQEVEDDLLEEAS